MRSSTAFVQSALAVLLTLGLAACSQQPSQPLVADTLTDQALPEGATACFYAKDAYQGAFFCADEDRASLGWRWNDRIQSVRVKNGYQVELFSGANFGGGSFVVAVDTRNLNSFNKRLSSFRVSKVATGSADLSQKCDVEVTMDYDQGGPDLRAQFVNIYAQARVDKDMAAVCSTLYKEPGEVRTVLPIEVIPSNNRYWGGPDGGRHQ